MGCVHRCSLSGTSKEQRQQSTTRTYRPHKYTEDGTDCTHTKHNSTRKFFVLYFKSSMRCGFGTYSETRTFPPILLPDDDTTSEKRFDRKIPFPQLKFGGFTIQILCCLCFFALFLNSSSNSPLSALSVRVECVVCFQFM